MFDFLRNLIGWSNGPTFVPVETTQHSVLHALVIGIDQYKAKDIPVLHGAVSDADAMDEYLRVDLNVPGKHIVNLRNTQATREAIVGNIKALCTREGLRRGDPILIYFAGHGSTAKAPKEWHAENQNISMIVPYDMDTSLGNAEASKCAIPDRTIGALLYHLAEQQGKDSIGGNITVIFDCCHSGSGTRELKPFPSSHSRRARGFISECVLPAELDKHIWSDFPQGRDAKVIMGFAQASAKSHVLLAACRETESAFEGDNFDGKKHGYFTKELLCALRTVKPDKITYQDLIQRIPIIPGQTPQCEGFNANCILFNALVPGGRRVAYRVDRPKTGEIVVCAGSINGVAEGTTFSVYPSRDFKLDDPPIASMIAVKVRPFTTDLTYLGPASPNVRSVLGNKEAPCFAVQSSAATAAALRLHVSTDSSQRPVWEALEQLGQTHRFSGGPSVLVVNDPMQASLVVHANGSDVTYTIREPLVTGSRGLLHLCDTTKARANAIQPVLSAASHFFWHLLHAPKKNKLNGRLEIEVHRLEVDEDADLGEDLRRPWVARGPNLHRTGVVDVVADDKTPYGIVVRNNFPVPLHIWAFYFNCSTLSISEYYRPPAFGPNAEAPLPGKRKLAKDELEKGVFVEGSVAADGCLKGELTIGHGAGAEQPYTFFLQAGQDLDVGFIKLFISTEPVDLSDIEQRSPFTMQTARDKGQAKNPPAPVWDTATIAVVQHKPT